MVEMAIGEKTTLEELGGARMHCTVSGCGDMLAATDEEAIELCRRYLAYMPGSVPRAARGRGRGTGQPGRSIEDIVPYDQRKWFDMYEVIDRIVDAGLASSRSSGSSPREIIVGFARLGGRAVGIVANQPKVKGGVLMVDSSDKAARFIWLCNAFNIPLVYLADVSGFMVGTKVERAGHHPPRRQDGVRDLAGHRAEDLRGRPQVLRRRALRDVRARLRARRRAVPAAGPDRHHGPRARRQRGLLQPDHGAAGGRAGRLRPQKREEYAQDVDIYKLASEMLVDGIIAGSELRDELIKRLAYAESKQLEFPPRRNPVLPV